MKYIPATGPRYADLIVVGEAPGAEEEREGKNFVGTAGTFLRQKLLKPALLNPDEVLYLNVSRFRPPGNDISKFIRDPRKDESPSTDEVRYAGKITSKFVPHHIEDLFREITLARPKVVIAFGNIAFWALTGLSRSITEWKGSVIPSEINGHKFLLIPIQHPSAILRQYSWRFHSLAYVRKARHFLSNPYNPTPYNFIPTPTYDTVIETLNRYLKEKRPIYSDIETIPPRTREHIECIGFCDSDEQVLCIPFWAAGKPYWSYEEESKIITLLRQVLSQVPIVGHNFVYDAQFTAAWWQVIPNLTYDTIVGHHTMFPALEKALDYQSSIYLLNHVFWKRSAKDDQFIYNCKDCLATKQITDEHKKLIPVTGLEEQINAQMRLYRPALKMMLRGVKRNDKVVDKTNQQLDQSLEKLGSSINKIVGYEINPNSTDQLKDLFYRQMQIDKKLRVRVTRSPKTGNPSLNEEALQKIATKEPALAPLCNRVLNYRSYSTYKGTFAKAKPDPDKRIRTSLFYTGTKTFRWASRKAASGRGQNLMNIPAGDIEQNKRGVIMPNMRRLIAPDDGYTIIDCDLKRADFYVVVWEADDQLFKQMLAEGVDIHSENAKMLGCSRHFGKEFIHATNYLATPTTCSNQFGITVKTAEEYQNRYFAEHPGIKAWQARVLRQLEETNSVTNAFGYRITYYDRISSIAADAVSWIPQSTVAIVINEGILNIEENLPYVELLFQDHDNIISQTPTIKAKEQIPKIVKQMSIPVPYNDPLVIPIDVKTSEESWGDVKKEANIDLQVVA